jgi:hypothetical protein
MAKFGRFQAGDKAPYEEYEGDFIQHGTGEYVRIISLTSRGEQIVVVVALRPGESIRKLSS